MHLLRALAVSVNLVAVFGPLRGCDLQTLPSANLHSLAGFVFQTLGHVSAGWFWAGLKVVEGGLKVGQGCSLFCRFKWFIGGSPDNLQIPVTPRPEVNLLDNKI